MSKYKVGDIVLVRSPAGDIIPKIHVKLKERVIVDPKKGKRVGMRTTIDWQGYKGWNAEIVYQNEADNLRKNWSIQFNGPGDITFVYDDCIIKKSKLKHDKIQKRRIVRKIKKN
jgi:hypothetical protein